MLRKTQLHLRETKDHGEASVSLEAASEQQPHCSGAGETPRVPGQPGHLSVCSLPTLYSQLQWW